MLITEEIARKVIATVDAGLSSGLGTPTPGNMCVEAAVCYALGLPHGDDPGCVSPALRRLKIRLNDSAWSSKRARGAGMRALAVAQLGSKGAFDDIEFSKRVATMTVNTVLPQALHAVARLFTGSVADVLRAAALQCISANFESAEAAAWAAAGAAAGAAGAAEAAAWAAAEAAAGAAWAAAGAAAGAAWAAAEAAEAAGAAWAAAEAAAWDGVLSAFAAACVTILVDMEAPGCQWLPLLDAQYVMGTGELTVLEYTGEITPAKGRTEVLPGVTQ